MIDPNTLHTDYISLVFEANTDKQEILIALLADLGFEGLRSMTTGSGPISLWL